MDGVLVTPLRRIATPGGPVYHGIKDSDTGFAGFGEAYFSTIEYRAIKGWKCHRRMTLNFVVPCGEVQLCIRNEATGANDSYVLGPGSDRTYRRLTIVPGLWVAFGGLGHGPNVMLNLANLAHDPAEATNKPLDTFPWTWEQQS